MDINFRGPLVITTQSNAIYHLGPALPMLGHRTVRKENGEELRFTQCKLAGSGVGCFGGGEVKHRDPIVGEQLALKPLNGPNTADIWYSSAITSIEQE